MSLDRTDVRGRRATDCSNDTYQKSRVETQTSLSISLFNSSNEHRSAMKERTLPLTIGPRLQLSNVF